MPIMLPAYISHHDSNFRTDIRTNRRMNWDGIVKQTTLDNPKD